MTPGLGSLQFNINDEELRMFKNIFQILFQQSNLMQSVVLLLLHCACFVLTILFDMSEALLDESDKKT